MSVINKNLVVPAKSLVESHRLCYGPVVRQAMLCAIVLPLLCLIPEYFVAIPDYGLLVKGRVGAALVLLLTWLFYSQRRAVGFTHVVTFLYVLSMSVAICLVGQILQEGSQYVMPYSVLLALLPGLLSIDYWLFVPCLSATVLVPLAYLFVVGCSARQWVMFSEMLLIASVLSFLLFLAHRRILGGMYGLLDSLRDAAGRDALTGLSNRSSWYSMAQQSFESSLQSGSALSVLYIDVDYFKSINDRYGHVYGDAVLRAVSRTLGDALPRRDQIARFGGEEFVVLLPGADLDQAVCVAERMHAVVNTMPDIQCELTISVGVAQRQPGELLDQMISRADSALLQAKSTGRNQTCLADVMMTGSLFTSE